MKIEQCEHLLEKQGYVKEIIFDSDFPDQPYPSMKFVEYIKKFKFTEEIIIEIIFQYGREVPMVKSNDDHVTEKELDKWKFTGTYCHMCIGEDDIKLPFTHLEQVNELVNCLNKINNMFL